LDCWYFSRKARGLPFGFKIKFKYTIINTKFPKI
jgi:hypothetical protein